MLFTLTIVSTSDSPDFRQMLFVKQLQKWNNFLEGESLPSTQDFNFDLKKLCKLISILRHYSKFS